jgi:hypothetical protein
VLPPEWLAKTLSLQTTKHFDPVAEQRPGNVTLGASLAPRDPCNFARQRLIQPQIENFSEFPDSRHTRILLNQASLVNTCYLFSVLTSCIRVKSARFS